MPIDPFALSLRIELISIDQVLVTLLPQSPIQVAWLSKLCAETPTAKPWRISRGAFYRYSYYQDMERLKKIGRDMTHLQFNAQTPMTPEKAAFIQQLRTQLTEEQARVQRLRQGLYWPFHRKSLRFFAEWDSVFQAGLVEIRRIERVAPARVTTAAVHTVQLPATERILTALCSPSTSEFPLEMDVEENKSTECDPVLCLERAETSLRESKVLLCESRQELAKSTATLRDLEALQVRTLAEKTAFFHMRATPSFSADPSPKVSEAVVASLSPV